MPEEGRKCRPSASRFHSFEFPRRAAARRGEGAELVARSSGCCRWLQVIHINSSDAHDHQSSEATHSQSSLHASVQQPQTGADAQSMEASAGR
jgi:hypothetical protein